MKLTACITLLTIRKKHDIMNMLHLFLKYHYGINFRTTFYFRWYILYDFLMYLNSNYNLFFFFLFLRKYNFDIKRQNTNK